MARTIDRAEMVAEYQAKFDSLTIQRTAAVEAGVKRILAGRARYEAVSRMTPNRVPWYFIGVLHYREASCNFRKNLANGQDYRRRTTIEPRGFGPWPSWEASAMWALGHEGFLDVRDWTPGACLFEGEKYNGEGYHYHGWDNPYLWSGTNYYTSGKYIRDRVYDPDVVDAQIGIAALMKRLLELTNPVASPAPLAIAGNAKGRLHPADKQAVVKSSRFMRVSRWYTDFCHYLGLSWALLFATFQQVQPYLTDWRTICMLGVLGGGYLAMRAGSFHLLRAAGQGRYTPSGLMLSASTSPPAGGEQPPVSDGNQAGMQGATFEEVPA